jgi:hypothetical protein
LISKEVVVDPVDMETHYVVPSDTKTTNRLCHKKIVLTTILTMLVGTEELFINYVTQIGKAGGLLLY